MDVVENLEARVNEEEKDPTLVEGEPENNTPVRKNGKQPMETPTIHSVPKEKTTPESLSQQTVTMTATQLM